MGQLVPFPAQRADVKPDHRRPDAPARIIRFIPPARLFIAGMAAQYPILKAVARRLGEICDPDRPARERLLERLIAALPALPSTADIRLESLIDAQFDRVCDLARTQLSRSRRDRYHYALGQNVWRDIEDPRLRQFAQRCAVIFTESLHLARPAAETEISAASA